MSNYKLGCIIRALTVPTINLLLPYKYNFYISLNPKSHAYLPPSPHSTTHPHPLDTLHVLGEGEILIKQFTICPYIYAYVQNKTQKHIAFFFFFLVYMSRRP